MLLSAVSLFVVIYTFKKNKFDRVEGALFFAAYVAYTIYLLVR